MSHRVELGQGVGSEFESAVPGRPVVSGFVGRSFALVLPDVDLAGIEVFGADGEGSVSLFGSPERFAAQLRAAADAVDKASGAGAKARKGRRGRRPG